MLAPLDTDILETAALVLTLLNQVVGEAQCQRGAGPSSYRGSYSVAGLPQPGSIVSFVYVLSKLPIPNSYKSQGSYNLRLVKSRLHTHH